MWDHRHKRYTDAEALAAAIAGGFSKLVGMDPYSVLIIDTNRTTTLDFTDVDLTAICSANAKFAFLQFQMRVDSITAGSANYAYVQVRQNGTTAAAGNCWLSGVHHVAGSRAYAYAVVPLDAGQVFEYTITIGGTVQVDTYITVAVYSD